MILCFISSATASARRISSRRRVSCGLCFETQIAHSALRAAAPEPLTSRLPPHRAIVRRQLRTDPCTGSVSPYSRSH